MQIRLTARLAGLTLAVFALPALAQDVDPGTVVATVGGEEITVGHMIVARTTLPQQYQQLPDDVLWEGLLDQLIQQVALAQSVTAPTMATQLTIQNQRNGLLAGEALGMVAAQAVTDEALEAAYRARFADASPVEEFNASHILLETEEDARAVLADLAKGLDFADLAEARSTGPSGPNGGALGWFTKGMMVPEFEAAVIALAPGEVSEPVQTQFGWHVVKLNESRIKDAPPLDEIRGELAQEIERAAIDARIAEVSGAAVIEKSAVEIDPTVLRSVNLLAN